MNRRTFLLSGLAAGAVLSTASPIARALMSSRMSPITVGMHVWVYAKHQPNFDVSPILPQIWKDVKYAGIDGVELMEQPLRRKDKTAEIANLIEEHDLPLIGTSYGANFWKKEEAEKIYDDLSNIFVNMQTLSARTIGISVRHPQGRIKTEKELDAQAQLLERSADLATKHGITLNMHNHTYEVENNLHDLAGTLQRLPNLKLGPDINWLIRAGVEPNQFLRKFKNNIVFLHLRDQHQSGKWSESLGEGDTDFDTISATLKDIDFAGDAMIELAHEDGFTPTRPIKESLKMSRHFVRETLQF